MCLHLLNAFGGAGSDFEAFASPLLRVHLGREVVYACICGSERAVVVLLVHGVCLCVPGLLRFTVCLRAFTSALVLCRVVSGGVYQEMWRGSVSLWSLVDCRASWQWVVLCTSYLSLLGMCLRAFLV